jgi:hypothetical protein
LGRFALAGGGLGAFQGGGGEDKTVAGRASYAAGGALVAVGLSTLAARKVAALLLNPDFTRWATKAMSKTPEQLGGHVGRLSSNLLNAEPEVQEAAAEFLSSIGQVAHAGYSWRAGQGQKNPLGVMSGQGR